MDPFGFEITWVCSKALERALFISCHPFHHVLLTSRPIFLKSNIYHKMPHQFSYTVSINESYTSGPYSIYFISFQFHQAIRQTAHKWIMEGLWRKYLRVNQKEEEEREYLDWDGWNTLKTIYSRWRLKVGDCKRWTEKNGSLQLRRSRLSEDHTAKGWVSVNSTQLQTQHSAAQWFLITLQSWRSQCLPASCSAVVTTVFSS